MNTIKKRRSFETGHFRKFLLVVDESQEVEGALYYAASRIQRSSGSIVMLYVIVPQEFQHWINVREQQVEEETSKAKALFRLFRRKLIDEDEDIAIMVLGASTDPKGPGPLVASLAAGTAAGSFPIPVTIVPGALDLEDIQALA